MCLASLIPNEETRMPNPHRHFCAAFRAMARRISIDLQQALKIIFRSRPATAFSFLTATAQGSG
jgi:hypothetical protein